MQYYFQDFWALDQQPYWLWVYKSSFKTGWLQALGIALLAVVVFFILSLIIVALVPIVSIILTFF
ncbi:MAG: hypothetical protein ACUVWK_07305 [Nitrososphaerales archaeon]